jgi:hypothetical protein
VGGASPLRVGHLITKKKHKTSNEQLSKVISNIMLMEWFYICYKKGNAVIQMGWALERRQTTYSYFHYVNRLW